jgi:muramoyltetrapeptide carboxypeptidase
MSTTGKLIYPRRLEKGDPIAVIAPAGPFDHDKLRQGLKVLTALGFQVHTDKDLAVKTGYLAGSDEHRGQLLREAFENPAIKAVICARGGYGSMRLLDSIDFSALRSSSKIFIGFSDVSALLSAIYARSGLVTFHGPVVTSLGSIDQISIDALLGAISSSEPTVLNTSEKGTVIRAGKAIAPVMAGNLATLCHLIGTPYQPDYNGHILLLEDIQEPPYKIDRMLTQFKLAGCLDNLVGLGLGFFNNCGSQEDLEDIVKNIFTGINIPILTGFQFGHGNRNVTIPVGVKATFDTDLKQLKFHRPATS